MRADQVLLEEAGTAIALLQELKYHVRGLIGIRPERDKTRMAMASAKIIDFAQTIRRGYL